MGTTKALTIEGGTVRRFKDLTPADFPNADPAKFLELRECMIKAQRLKIPAAIAGGIGGLFIMASLSPGPGQWFVGVVGAVIFVGLVCVLLPLWRKEVSLRAAAGVTGADIKRALKSTPRDGGQS